MSCPGELAGPSCEVGGDESPCGGVVVEVFMLRKLHLDALDELDIDRRILGADLAEEEEDRLRLHRRDALAVGGCVGWGWW